MEWSEICYIIIWNQCILLYYWEKSTVVHNKFSPYMSLFLPWACCIFYWKGTWPTSRFCENCVLVLGSFCNGIAIFVGYIYARSIFVIELHWYYSTHSGVYKGIDTFPMSNSRKVNVVAWLVFELAFFVATIKRAR